MAENHKEILEKVKCRLSVNEPFFGHLLTSTTILPHSNINKFQVYGNIIYYNKKHIENTDISKLSNQLLHCVMHKAFCHFVRRKDRTKEIWDQSTDIAINNILKFENNKNIDGVTDSKHRNKSAEAIYEELKIELDGKTGFRIAFDEHVDTLDRESEEEALRNVIEAHAMAKVIGKLPRGVSELIKNLLEPKLNWKEYLRKFATECFCNEDYSFTNPRKCLLPYGIYCPSLVKDNDVLKQLVVAIDTSGSITTRDLEEFIAEIRMLHHLSERTKVITCDAIIQDVFTLNIHDAFKTITIKGRGGTDFRPVFDYVEKNHIAPTLLIYLTDGYGSYPKKQPGYPVMWALTNKYDVPWGQKIMMENE